MIRESFEYYDLNDFRMMGIDACSCGFVEGDDYDGYGNGVSKDDLDCSYYQFYYSTLNLQLFPGTIY